MPEASCDEDPELHRPQIVFDRYHVVAKINEAVDEVRRAESKSRPELKGSRYIWLKNETNLTARQRETLTWLTRPSMRLKTVRAARWRDDFNGFFDKSDPDEAETYLKRWCYGAKRSRLEPVKAFVATVEAHWDGIIAWHRHRLSNGLLEGTNSLVQAAKRWARGYRSEAKMITASTSSPESCRYPKSTRFSEEPKLLQRRRPKSLAARPVSCRKRLSFPTRRILRITVSGA